MSIDKSVLNAWRARRYFARCATYTDYNMHDMMQNGNPQVPPLMNAQMKHLFQSSVLVNSIE